MSIYHRGHYNSLALTEHKSDFCSHFLHSLSFCRNQNAIFLPDNTLSCLSPNKIPQETNSSGGPVLWNIRKDVSHHSSLGKNHAISHRLCSYLVKQIQLKSMVRHLLEFYPGTLMEPGFWHSVVDKYCDLRFSRQLASNLPVCTLEIILEFISSVP